ncbi:Transketolase, N-terminal subunit [Methanocaldococcus bathoardescens]|uniref:Transketolase, N-terminal subunit n=1 Tax=Methanocaldococcus bathoardescens TaxID=1301915 RepID=A0A076LKF7_9EURY|nr:transketolase [Methanocaldococcus bathoardescens]AIJ06059.1 Transketolase, N-terminal subunit [Methanocaldococcus bathoardescens]
MDNNLEIKDLEKIAKKVRYNIVKMVGLAKSGHPGGSLSATDIIVALYFKLMNYDPKNPYKKDRDRFVLSKGHAAPALYAVLAELGIIEEEELWKLRRLEGKLQGHPSMDTPGVEICTGSLGQGFSAAVGMALGCKLDKLNNYVYVLLGDGECQEGIVWEAAMAAAHYKLDNLIAFVDRNKLQIDGCTEDVMSLGDIKAKFEAFGWDVFEIDGHNFEEIIKTVEKAKNLKNGKPKMIIAYTIKGKGVSFMENNVAFHGKAPNEEQLKQALEELKYE